MWMQKIDFSNLDKTYRANLINSATGCKPAHLIATKSAVGYENVAIFSSVVHLGSYPALVGFVHRPVGDFSHTYKNILETDFYTINHVNQVIAKQAHQTHLKYAEEISEFSACGLHSSYLDNFYAPFVMESSVKMSLKLLEVIDIKYNETKFIIGEIINLYTDQNFIMDCGTFSLDKAGSIAVSGQDTYFNLSTI